ncbi:hypothetical protein [Streptomyces griseorubiginosus]|uniref:hypothetical protein n=1 Tax=Streptomyces griseorubiginosus TaxID=67304 RepID=UPI0036E98836
MSPKNEKKKAASVAKKKPASSAKKNREREAYNWERRATHEVVGSESVPEKNPIIPKKRPAKPPAIPQKKSATGTSEARPERSRAAKRQQNS